MICTLRPKAVEISVQSNYRLLITFSNNEKRIFNVEPYLCHKIFEKLKNPIIFQTVKPAGLSIAWIHGQDICPDDLYYNSDPFLDEK